MTKPWAVTVSAADADAGRREMLALTMREWLAAGGDGVALVTCHRAELYGFGEPPLIDGACSWSGWRAVAHLMRVACGLESVIVGEDEVLHQVRQALRYARTADGLDRRLARLFETAIAAGRSARSRRTESGGTLAESAVGWLCGKTDVAGRTVLVAGAGHMGAALAKLIEKAGASIVIASRDAGRASRLAGRYAGRGVDLKAGAELIGQAAGVAVALGGPWSDVERAAVDALPPIVDISAPPAVPDSVRSRLNGSFLGIDELYRRGGTPPGAYIKDAERLVDLKTAEYMAWLGQAA